MIDARRVAAHAALVALLAGAGCAAAVQANRRAPGSLSDGRFTPGRAAVATYGPNAELSCPSDAAADILGDDLKAAVRDARKPPPAADGRLCAMADTFLGWTDAEPPPPSVIRAIGWHFGVVTTVGRVVVATIETEDAKIVAQRVFDTAAPYMSNASVPRYGFSSQRAKKGATRVAVVMQDAAADVDNVPVKVPAGGAVTVAGRLLGAYVNPRVVAADPVGKIEMPTPQPGKDFRAELRCGAKPGRMLVEVRGDLQGETQSVARFPIACGTDLPAGIAVPAAQKGSIDPDRAARRLFDLMNVERKSAGVPALQWDDAVASVARTAAEHLRDTAQSGQAPSLDLVAALKKVDIASPLVLQNPVSAPNVEEANALIASSPVSRANLLNAQATHAGAGIATWKTPQGFDVIFGSELLVRQLPPVDVAKFRTELRAAIAKRRADARSGPLGGDALLDQVAQKYAEALAATRGNLAREKESEIVSPLYKSFRTVNVISGVKVEPLEFAEEPGIVGEAKVLGIGAALGTSPALGKNSVFVVVLTGTRR